MYFSDYLLQVYLWGCIPAWPLSSYAIARYFYKEEGELDNENLAISILVGICLNWFWPLFLPGYWIWEWLKGHFGEV